MYLKDYFREYFSKKPRGSFLDAVGWFSIWLKSIKQNINSFESGIPWINLPACRFLEKHLQKNSIVLEYGVGGSTIFFLRKYQRLVSIEHDEQWLRKATKAATKKNIIKKWKWILKKPAKNSKAKNQKKFQKCADPLFLQSYAKAAEIFKDGSFDCIMIDGLARDACFIHAHKKLKKGGILVLDDSERDYFRSPKSLQELKEYRVIFDAFGPRLNSRYFNRCTIYQKTT